jgi:hypothetical protein
MSSFFWRKKCEKRNGAEIAPNEKLTRARRSLGPANEVSEG